MSTQLTPAQEEKVANWLIRTDIVDRFENALGGFMTGDMFAAQILSAFQDPEIAKCTIKSQCDAALQCAALGLLPTLDQVALVPRMLKGQGLCATVVPQWQGFKSLMERHPDVLEVNAYLVHAVADEYEMVNGRFHHKFDPFDPQRTFKSIADLKGGYMVVSYRDHSRPVKYHFATAAYIDQCRLCAETQMIWNKWFEQQALKTVYRSAWSRRVVNFDPVIMKRLQELADTDDSALGNDPSRVQTIPPPGLPADSTRQSRAMLLAGTVTGAAAPAREPAHTEAPSNSSPAGEVSLASAEPPPNTADPEPSTAAAARPEEAAPGQDPPPSTIETELTDEERAQRDQFRDATMRRFQTCKGQAEREKIFDELCGMDMGDETRDLVAQWNQAAKDRLNAARKPSGQKPLINQ